MTAWQNQPPLSRRQARDSARVQGAEPEVDATPEAAGGTDAAEAPSPQVTPGSGRRVQWDPSSAEAEPLTYMTQARIPSEDRLPVAPGAAGDADAAPVAEQMSDPGFRVRDFRPERRSSFAPMAPGAAEPWSPPTMSGSSDAPAPSGEDEAKADGWNRPLPSDLAAPERTMTRRELRMLRERALADGEPEPSVVFGPEGVAVTTSSISVVPPNEREAVEPEAVAEPVVSAEPVADDAGVVTEEPVILEASDDPEIVALPEPDFVIPALVEPTSAAPHHQEIDPEDEDEIVVEAELVEETPDSSPTESERPTVGVAADETGSSRSAQPAGDMRRPVVPASEAIFGASPTASAPVVTPPPVTPAPTPYGHWSTQGDVDDLASTGDTALSRNVGVSTGAITTHALVLPSIPESGDQLLTPLTQTGEIMVTGSIDLPRSFGSTGAHPPLFDHPDVDAIIDDADRDDATAESAPVRAVRAVASNSSARAVIEAPAPRKSRLPLILGIVGGAVLLVAIGVIVTVFVINGV